MAAAVQFEPSHEEAVSVLEACRRLAGISRATFYRIPYFRTRRIRTSEGRVGILVSDIDLYLKIQAGKV